MFEKAKTTKSLKAVLYAIGAVTYGTIKFIIYESDFEGNHKHITLPFSAVGIVCKK